MSTEETRPYSCVLITPARDEAAFIGKALEAVVVQTVLPLKWVIVSDGSTDGTDDLVQGYTAKYDWIELLRMPERKERDFAGKVHAFNAGYARVRHLDFDIVGNLDADASFEPDYLEYLLDKFAQNPGLGVAGTNYLEDSWAHSLQYDYRFTNIEDVTGQCQLFRRECFEAIGGYRPSKHGGVDYLATLSARMHGWQTRVFTDKFLIHHRQQGTASAHWLLVEFHTGRKDYMFGGHPLWEICRVAYHLTRNPVVIGGCLLFAGYFWAMLSRTDKTFPPEVIEFRRKEQLIRLRKFFSRRFVPSAAERRREADGLESPRG
jgi:poly-beta-1,6-N-acetyl-D-glucosamine synthase